jgi:hypothetical protein
VQVRVRPGSAVVHAGRHGARRAAPTVGSRHAAVLDLQRAAGNRAVAGLVTPVVQAKRDFAPIKDLTPSGAIDSSTWTSTHQQARAALAKGDASTAESLYRQLYADAATIAGVATLPGFDPKQITVGRSAKGGLNLSLDAGDKPGHTGWVDSGGTFGVPLDFSKGVPAVQVGLMVSPSAFKDDKELSMRTIRHEMVHAHHHVMTLDAIKRWDAAGRKPGFEAWVDKHAKDLHLSDVDLVMVKKVAVGGEVDTEVLGYVEGFMTEFHLAPATKAGSGAAFFELLGAVETSKYRTWQQANDKVKKEALARLQDYYGTLDAAHRKHWKDWVDDGVAKSGSDKTGRKEFYAALATFVK